MAILTKQHSNKKIVDSSKKFTNVKPMRKRVPVILIITGIILLIGVMGFGVFSKLQQAQMIDSYVSDVVKNDNKSDENLKKAEEFNKELLNDSFFDSSDILDQYNSIFPGRNGIMGVLEIQKISLRLPIYHGTADDSLMKGVGHAEGTSFPINTDGQKSILTGHNGVPGADMLFTRLDEMKKNDTFDVHMGKMKYTYKIKELKVLTPDETDDYAHEHNSKNSKAEVTLVTCTPYGINSHRLLVIGVFDHEEESKELKKMPLSIGKETTVIFVIIAIGLASLIMIYLINKQQTKGSFDEEI